MMPVIHGKRIILVAFVAELLLIVLLRPCNGSQEKAAALMKCFDNQSCLSKPTAWEHFTEDLPSCLVAARVWWSSRPAGIPVTLVTQLSVERLEQLQAQCATWGGPLAAALYLPLSNPSGNGLSDANKQELRAMEASADAFFEANEKQGVCQLRLILIYELFAEPRAMVLYPVNSLRNYARLMADTDLITNIDVDMIPSVSISTALADPDTLALYTEGCHRGSVYVFPAFETHCGGATQADVVAQAGKAQIEQFLKQCLHRMRPSAPASHNATNYDQWLAGDTAYLITYKPNFEPWFLSWRWGTLWYDFRYRGYGKNKIVQAAAMNATGTSWRVSPHGFLVHREHTESKIKRQFLRAKFSRKDMDSLRGTVYEHVESLWAATKMEQAAGRYLARLEGSFQTCMDSLDWWRYVASE